MVAFLIWGEVHSLDFAGFPGRRSPIFNVSSAFHGVGVVKRPAFLSRCLRAISSALSWFSMTHLRRSAALFARMRLQNSTASFVLSFRGLYGLFLDLYGLGIWKNRLYHNRFPGRSSSRRRAPPRVLEILIFRRIISEDNALMCRDLALQKPLKTDQRFLNFSLGFGSGSRFAGESSPYQVQYY